MLRNIARACLATLGLLAGFSLAGGPAAAQQFSAELVNSTPAGKAQQQKIFVADGKLRIEGSSGRGGVVLADANAGTAFILMTQERIYMDSPRTSGMVRILMPADPDNPCPQWQEMAKADNGPDADWTCNRVGPDTVNGRSAVKYEATSPEGEQNHAWIDPKLKVMVKSESAQGGMELQDVKEGPQQASLFEVPAGYKKMDMQEIMKRLAPKGGATPPEQ